MNLSSGGLAILAIAAIWFLVFLPSFVKGDQSKGQGRDRSLDVTETINQRLGEKAQLALRARRKRSVFAVATVVAFVVAGLSVLEFTVTGAGLPLAIGSVLITSVLTWFTYRAHINYRNQLTGSVRRSVPITTSTLATKNEQTQSSAGWQPGTLPKQSYLQTGAIEIVELAEVVELETEPVAEQDIRIDEILRRRRHIG